MDHVTKAAIIINGPRMAHRFWHHTACHPVMIIYIIVFSFSKLPPPACPALLVIYAVVPVTAMMDGNITFHSRLYGASV